MYTLFSIPMILVIICVIHIIKTGRDRYWIWLVVFIPVAGMAAYLFIEVLPDLTRNKKVTANVTKIINPGKTVRDLEDRLRLLDSVANRVDLADEYVKIKRYKEAMELYEKCLEGIHAKDIDILRKTANAAYLAKDYEKTREYILKIKEISDGELPGYEMHQRLAQVYDKTGNTEKADEEYRNAIDTYNHIETIYNYGKFLLGKGRNEEAKQQFEKILVLSTQLPKFHRQEVSRWINLTKKEIADLLKS